MTRAIDYSLYLVTGRELLPPGKAIKGGVTVVQVREKNIDTKEFLQIALETKQLCRKYDVPLIINDRIDIALAIHADGVHLGQSDMPIAIARQLLPQGTIIGTSVNTIEEAKKAKADGVDYIGIGAVWTTSSKKLTAPVLGVRGVGPILEVLKDTEIRAVAIGGIKITNALRALHGAIAPSDYRYLDGLAVVSEVVASPKPFETARELSHIIKSFKSFKLPPVFSFHSAKCSVDSFVSKAGKLLESVRALSPLVHQLQEITNIVVSTQSANATLALGASPIMSNASEEMSDLSKIIGGLLINIGTITNKECMLLAVVFDPVAVGATAHRKSATEEFLNEFQPTVIKGNAGEIGALVGSLEAKSRGVDSIGPGFANPAEIVRRLARRERCIVLLTGETDWISDGDVVIKVANGHCYLSSITGSGCMLGTCVATFCAAASLSAPPSESLDRLLVGGDMLIATLGGLLALTVASELAGERPDVKGTGTFLPALIDALFHLTPEQITERAKVEIVI
ncbi:hypothetical protein Clacol_000677 [Clathrus columnatus]|uniref:Thiamine phosphate synthase/TenI domain-containing protein n=1 Tax=Clathrus columnatus TaxID=1419009 RepID=A0AAV5A0E4_9AGAM|nr:hypothetical protein Clacol_000677 [Clathrus columnatus]